MKRDVFSEEHELFRAECRRFVEAEIAPHVERWNAEGISDRDTWRKLGAAGYLGANVPEEFGGAGADFLFDAIIMEELAYARAHAVMMSLHSDICLPYLVHYGNEPQKQQHVTRAVSGETILAIAMTEPGTGSDLANVQTKAIRDGDEYVINGAKTFISNGQLADLVIVVAKTDPEASPPHDGISLILVEGDAPGFRRGRNLEKLGLKGQDTSELFFEDCRVPVSNLLGGEGEGFKMLMTQLQQERLCIGVSSIASCQRTLDDTVAYVKERKAFGKPIGAFQNTQFKLWPSSPRQVEVGQAFVDKLLAAHVRGEDIVAEVSMAKWWTTDLQKRLTAECLQLFGGYGFMSEYPISTRLRGRRGPVDLCGHERDHEGDHCATARSRVAGRRSGDSTLDARVIIAAATRARLRHRDRVRGCAPGRERRFRRPARPETITQGNAAGAAASVARTRSAASTTYYLANDVIELVVDAPGSRRHAQAEPRRHDRGPGAARADPASRSVRATRCPLVNMSQRVVVGYDTIRTERLDEEAARVIVSSSGHGARFRGAAVFWSCMLDPLVPAPEEPSRDGPRWRPSTR